MAIRIQRNEAGNCINFHGSSNPTYWNACLSAEVDNVDANSVNVINDVITAATGVTQYEFFRIPYTDFVDAEGNAFASATEAATYITANANVLGIGTGIDMIGVDICFKLDATSTSIMFDNGYSYGVNTIKAVPDADGTIHIKSKLADLDLFYNIEHTRVCINDNPVSGGLNDVANSLNELFTVGAFQEVVITDPYSTLVADVAGVNTTMTVVGANGVDPIGDDVFGASASGSLNGYKSTETISQAGEYFTFDIRNEAQIGFGLVHSQASFDAGYYSGNATYADPTNFGTFNSAHGGFQFSHWFHPTPNGSWTNYGANTSYVQGEAWYNSNVHFEGRDNWLGGSPIKMRVGIDENGFIGVWSIADDQNTWKLHARSSYPVPQGAEFHLGIKCGDTVGRVYTLPKIHELEESAPTMNFRYVESPDGSFHFPLFATQEEADYYIEQNGGTAGSGTVQVFPDDPTNTIWYAPNPYYNSDQPVPPVAETFLGNPVFYTEVTTLTNADLAPAAYTGGTITVNELQSVNIQTQPQDTDYTTTITGLPFGLIDLGDGTITGTAPEVTSDNVANPSDDYTITVTRTNTYGSSSGTFTLRVNNLTAPVVQPITGFTWEPTSTALVDPDTLDDGSVVHLDDTVASGRRLIIPKSWVETNVLPNLTEFLDFVVIGIANGTPSWSTVDTNDFDAYIKLEWASSSSHTTSIGVSGSNSSDIVVQSLTDAYYDYAFEVDGTDVHVIRCNFNSINNEPSVNDGGSFSGVVSTTKSGDPHTVSIGVRNTTCEISEADLNEIDIPATPVTNLTSWTKALNFSGSNEYTVNTSNSYYANPLNMGGLGAQVSPNVDLTKTSASTLARPFATAIVFKPAGNNSNQHIWNAGEGAATNQDNIYLRQSASGQLFFGWGREGAGNNEVYITTVNSNNWYGVYIAHKGQRFGASSANATNLKNAFDIRVMTNESGDNFNTVYSLGNLAGNWTSTGTRMDRQFTGNFTIGGRANNRSFHGKVASMVITTLRTDFAMPTDAEIKLMITDPKKWEDDYRDSNFVRWVNSTSYSSYTPSNINIGYGAVQMWLMGDGSMDSYANGIRNEVYPADQNYTKLQLNSMVSNDIENVNINGLS
jgi:hypothetical protein